jgi:hypothetical protein
MTLRRLLFRLRWRDNWTPPPLVPEGSGDYGEGRRLWLEHAAVAWRRYRQGVIASHLAAAAIREIEWREAG